MKNSAEIEALFDGLKKKKEEKKKAIEEQEEEKKQVENKKRKLNQEIQKVLKQSEAKKKQQNPQPKLLRYDPDGLPIYTEESLRIDTGGETADCPFDCWCCF